MTIGCNIRMICLKLTWFVYGLSRMLQFSQFVWTPCYSVWDVFNNFLLIDATDRSKISSDWKRFFIALSLYPLSFFANTPFKSWSVNPEFLRLRKRLGLSHKHKQVNNQNFPIFLLENIINVEPWFQLIDL